MKLLTSNARQRLVKSINGTIKKKMEFILPPSFSASDDVWRLSASSVLPLQLVVAPARGTSAGLLKTDVPRHISAEPIPFHAYWKGLFLLFPFYEIFWLNFWRTFKASALAFFVPGGSSELRRHAVRQA